MVKKFFRRGWEAECVCVSLLFPEKYDSVVFCVRTPPKHMHTLGSMYAVHGA